MSFRKSGLIFACSFFFLAFAGAQQLHFLLVAPRAEDQAHLALEQLTKQAAGVAQIAGFQFDKVEIKGQLVKAELLEKISNLAVGEKDVIWFYYYGPAGYNEDVLEDFPYIDAVAGRIFESEINKQLLKKNARLTLTFFDCLNYQTGSFADAAPQLPADPEKVRKLFKVAGNLVVTSSYKHQVSTYNPTYGGSFTTAFLNALEYLTAKSTKHQVKWGELLFQTQRYMELMLEKVKKEQSPFAQLKIPDHELAHGENPSYDTENISYGYAIPAFPFPPPRASATRVLPNLFFSSARTLGDVDRILRKAIDDSGYNENSYFSVPGGFALVTRVEQFNADGTSKENPYRWNDKVTALEDFTIVNYLKALFLGRTGRFRIFAFLVTPVPFNQTGEEIKKEKAREWLSEGFNYLPKPLGNQPFTEDFKCTVLVYEFIQPESGQAKLVQPGSLSGDAHLEKSYIIHYLERTK